MVNGHLPTAWKLRATSGGRFRSLSGPDQASPTHLLKVSLQEQVSRTQPHPDLTPPPVELAGFEWASFGRVSPVKNRLLSPARGWTDIQYSSMPTLA